MKYRIYTFYNLSRQIKIPSRINSICTFNCFTRLSSTKMKFLNVAEKNDAAKNIALHLSRGTSRRREGLSQYNKIYEFEADVMGQKSDMVMTSVSGHLLALEFVGNYKNWQNCSPLSLFDAPVFKYCPENYDKIKKTLEREIKNCQGLIIWTDCDREGENIGFEIIQVCTAVKNNINIYRAKFSEITAVSVRRALNNLEQPNKNISDAVDVRQELDLRIGAAFTRFQTLRLQRVFPTKLADSLVSYGSCQFPTLGFVVERYRAVENFISEPFWKIKATHKLNNLTVEFNWERVRLFDQEVCQVLHNICKESPLAKVCEVKTKPKSKWRPLPLDTVELEKLASRKLKINAKETMRLAERLYTQGFISYPRTETNEYPREMNLGQLVGHHTGDPNWGAFAQGILDSGGPTPRQGNKSDKAHPPIHPTKYTNSLTGNEQRLHEFIVRSFLACCSKDAQGQETTVSIDVSGERFTASGLMITERNYLDVYPYDKWSSKEIHVYQMGQTFNPTSIDMVNGSTSPPNLLTEADLIALMEKHGIGTDATHAEHIETIKSRSYVALADSVHFVPGLLGMGLVEGYDAMGLTISKPHLRAQLEADLKAISEGRKQPQAVLAEQIAAYKEVYIKVTEEANKIDLALAERFSEQPVEYTSYNQHRPVDMIPVLKCPKCGSDMTIRSKKSNAEELYIGCMSYPNCKNAVWLPSLVRTMEVTRDTCPTCGPNFKLIKFQWRNNSLSHLYPPPYTGCIGGCDMTLLELMNINLSSIKNIPSNNRTNVPSNGPSVPSNRPTVPNNRPNVPTNNTQGQNRTNQTRVENTTQARQFVPPPAVNRVQNPAENRQGIGTNRSQNPILNRSQSVSQNSVRSNPSFNRSQSAGTATSRMPMPGNGDDSEENSVVCNCNKSAILLTVRKQNENFGKKFYKCPVGKENGGCDFFSWALDADSGIQSNTTSSTDTSTSGWGNSNGAGNTGSNRGWGIAPRAGNSTSFDSGNDETVLCDCRLPCKKITVHKEGRNKGRPFYGCAKEVNHRCKFFQWADEDGGASGSWGVGRESSSRGRGGRTNPDGPRARKCGLCREEGHNRNKCPRNNSTDY